MNKTMNTGNRFLDSLKRVLVRFKMLDLALNLLRIYQKLQIILVIKMCLY